MYQPFSSFFNQWSLRTILLDPLALGLSTKGSTIIDAKGNPIRLACVNWYGAHMERYVVHGLDEVHID